MVLDSLLQRMSDPTRGNQDLNWRMQIRRRLKKKSPMPQRLMTTRIRLITKNVVKIKIFRKKREHSILEVPKWTFSSNVQGKFWLNRATLKTFNTITDRNLPMKWLMRENHYLWSSVTNNWKTCLRGQLWFTDTQVTMNSQITWSSHSQPLKMLMLTVKYCNFLTCLAHLNIWKVKIPSCWRLQNNQMIVFWKL
jgi:hypothetical protein